MLTFYDFNALSDAEKADAVWQGTFLADREENGLAVQLYTVNSFYVEVFYDQLENKLVRFHAFSSKNFLVPYLAHIKFNVS
ncbi:hypothetical protein FO440_20660 [Mucilaginibacter corticis]|uniref:Uncharacterized protein n=1 Tax=Mucilaginibacter corticis TaxID=2597670 RepID=A0A556MGF1_9SPHI|nr:hypothetical protein [Mucilaginibacter corticis]TSJ38912.1 hypothetical protein FO440_20660 [Mucilaginibacter corticis]